MGLTFSVISRTRLCGSLQNCITSMTVKIKEQVTEEHVERFGSSSQYLAGVGKSGPCELTLM